MSEEREKIVVEISDSSPSKNLIECIEEDEEVVDYIHGNVCLDPQVPENEKIMEIQSSKCEQSVESVIISDLEKINNSSPLKGSTETFGKQTPSKDQLIEDNSNKSEPELQEKEQDDPQKESCYMVEEDKAEAGPEIQELRYEMIQISNGSIDERSKGPSITNENENVDQKKIEEIRLKPHFANNFIDQVITNEIVTKTEQNIILVEEHEREEMKELEKDVQALSDPKMMKEIIIVEETSQKMIENKETHEIMIIEETQNFQLMALEPSEKEVEEGDQAFVEPAIEAEAENEALIQVEGSKRLAEAQVTRPDSNEKEVDDYAIDQMTNSQTGSKIEEEISKEDQIETNEAKDEAEIKVVNQVDIEKNLEQFEIVEPDNYLDEPVGVIAEKSTNTLKEDRMEEEIQQEDQIQYEEQVQDTKAKDEPQIEAEIRIEVEKNSEELEAAQPEKHMNEIVDCVTNQPLNLKGEEEDKMPIETQQESQIENKTIDFVSSYLVEDESKDRADQENQHEMQVEKVEREALQPKISVEKQNEKHSQQPEDAQREDIERANSEKEVPQVTEEKIDHRIIEELTNRLASFGDNEENFTNKPENPPKLLVKEQLMEVIIDDNPQCKSAPNNQALDPHLEEDLEMKEKIEKEKSESQSQPIENNLEERTHRPIIQESVESLDLVVIQENTQIISRENSQIISQENTPIILANNIQEMRQEEKFCPPARMNSENENDSNIATGSNETCSQSLDVRQIPFTSQVEEISFINSNNQTSAQDLMIEEFSTPIFQPENRGNEDFSFQNNQSAPENMDQESLKPDKKLSLEVVEAEGVKETTNNDLSSDLIHP